MSRPTWGFRAVRDGGESFSTEYCYEFGCACHSLTAWELRHFGSIASQRKDSFVLLDFPDGIDTGEGHDR